MEFNNLTYLVLYLLHLILVFSVSFPLLLLQANSFKIAAIISGPVFLILLVLVFLFASRKRKSSPATPLESDHYARVSYQELHQATSGFSPDNLIGSGSFGSVYKGFLNQIGSSVAIKVLKLQNKGALKSFISECNALKNVRHRNLVKLLTYCSSLDYKRNEFKALIFEFMESGNLESWLHQNNQLRNCLNFLQRLNIAIDVASVLHYLHELCETPIIHCDLKPSNVLLDEDMVAHVSDFGLAKMFSSTVGSASDSQTSSIGINGTLGYAPPEYAMGIAASKEGDVYSYGILVLEMFTGKRPTDMMFEDGFNLHSCVKNAIPEKLNEIMDPTLLAPELEETSEASNRGKQRQTRENDKLEKCLFPVFQIGVACSRDLPKDRLRMADVAKELHLIKSSFLGVRIYA